MYYKQYWQNTAKIPQYFFIKQVNLTIDPILIVLKIGARPMRPPGSATYGNGPTLWHLYLSLSAVTASIHYLPRCLRSTVSCGKTPNIVTWTEHTKICCHVIFTQKRPTVKKSARKFGNFPLQANERTWVKCKVTIVWHQNNEPGCCGNWCHRDK